MFTQMKLPDGNIWLCEQDPTHLAMMRIADTPHNRELVVKTDTKFEIGYSFPRSKYPIMGHIHSLPDQQEIERRNNRRARSIIEHRRETIGFSIGACAHWVR